MRRPRPKPRDARERPTPARALRRPTETPVSADAALAAELAGALRAGDMQAAAQLRARLARSAPETVEGAEAAFKLGLYRLFVDRDPVAAMEALRLSVRARANPWSRQARMSLGQLLLRFAKPQQAAFEFRKVVADNPKDLVATQALAFLGAAMHALGKGVEAERLVRERVQILRGLSSAEGPEGAIAKAWLGFELKTQGMRRDAEAVLQAALSDPDLPEDERTQVEAALEGLR